MLEEKSDQDEKSLLMIDNGKNTKSEEKPKDDWSMILSYVS